MTAERIADDNGDELEHGEPDFPGQFPVKEPDMTTETREPAQPVPTPWTGVTEGRIVHVRVPGVSHCQPAIVTQHWGDGGSVNLQVFRDGFNDHEGPSFAVSDRSSATRWATSVPHESKIGTGQEAQSWHWPERA